MREFAARSQVLPQPAGCLIEIKLRGDPLD
jgi:hypothetical protein